MNHALDQHAAVDDATIVRGLHRGDRAAWTALYDQYSVRVWTYVARLVGPERQAVADIVQETFLSAARACRQFDARRGSLWNWLSGIAHNHVANHWRQRARADRVLDFAAPGGPLAHWLGETSNAPPPRELEDRELAGMVREVLARLPADYVLILTAKYIDNLSIAELQPLCGGTAEALRSRLARAREAFREAYHRLTADPRAADCDRPSSSPAVS